MDTQCEAKSFFFIITWTYLSIKKSVINNLHMNIHINIVKISHLFVNLKWLWYFVIKFPTDSRSAKREEVTIMFRCNDFIKTLIIYSHELEVVPWNWKDRVFKRHIFNEFLAQNTKRKGWGAAKMNTDKINVLHWEWIK